MEERSRKTANYCKVALSVIREDGADRRIAHRMTTLVSAVCKSAFHRNRMAN